MQSWWPAMCSSAGTQSPLSVLSCQACDQWLYSNKAMQRNRAALHHCVNCMASLVLSWQRLSCYVLFHPIPCYSILCRQTVISICWLQSIPDLMAEQRLSAVCLLCQSWCPAPNAYRLMPTAFSMQIFSKVCPLLKRKFVRIDANVHAFGGLALLGMRCSCHPLTVGPVLCHLCDQCSIAYTDSRV